MSSYGLDDSYDESYDESYDDNYDESYEEARGRGKSMKAVTPPRAATPYNPRSSQLTALASKLTSQINAVGAATAKVDARVRGVASNQDQMANALRKEVAERKRSVLALTKGVNDTRQISALLPFIETLAPNNSQLPLFAPLLLLGNDINPDNPSTTSSGILGGLGLGGGTGGSGGLLQIVALLAIFGKLGGTASAAKGV